MKNYKDMTYRYLKGQKNRTLLTIFGIILSVALISAIGTIIASARGALIKEAIRDSGSYHGAFVNMDRNSVGKLKNHIDVGEVGLTKAEGYAATVETTEQERIDYGQDVPFRYIEVQGYDNKAKELLPIKLKEGRLPRNSNEIILEKWMIKYIDENIKLGDKVNLNMVERDIKYETNEFDEQVYKGETSKKIDNREYTIVGFIDSGYMWRANLISKGITGLDLDKDEDGKYGTYFMLNNIKNAQEKIENIAKDMSVDDNNIVTNFRVLRLYAESPSDTFNSSIIGIVIFVISLIMLSTIAVIYNSFNISVLERISQFGLLRSIGATPKQIRAIVLKEAVILSCIGIPIGLFSGILAMKIVLYIIGLLKSDITILNEMEVTISITVFLISTIVGLVTVFLSAIGPARQAGKVSPLEAVKNTGELKRESLRKVRSSKLIRKTMGIEGEIAHKNLRRNRKRFIITVFSMIVSITLFIVFSTFSDYLFKIGAIDTGKFSDFQIYGDIDNIADDIYDKLIQMEDVDRVYKRLNINGEVLLKENQISKKLMNMTPYLQNQKKDGLIQLSNVGISSIGDDNIEVLKNLLKSGSLDIDKLNKDNGVLVINDTYMYKQNTNTQTLLEGFHLNVGDKIPFASYEYDITDEDTKYTELTVVGVLEKGILGEEYNYNGSINMITTEQVWEKLYLGESPPEELRSPNINLNIEMIKDGNRDNISNYLKELDEEMPELHYIDAVERAKESRTMAIIMSIFIYGFITLIALISAINIINTISTNIILRTKEIAMIKAVGMTQVGIKKMVAFESLFYGMYATIFGGSLGIVLTYILHTLLIGISEFEYKLPWTNVAVACIGAITISLLSGRYPLKRINDKIIVESMKSDN